MKQNLDNSMIENFSILKDKENVQNFYNICLSILSSGLDDLKISNLTAMSNIDEFSLRIFPMGDYTNDTFIDENGELEIVIASSNSQLILANKLFFDNLKNIKSNKKLKHISNKGTIDDFVLSFFKVLVNYFTEKTTILLINDGIKILCNEEYGFKILLRFATYSESDENAILNFYDPINKTTKQVNLFVYNENISNKDSLTNGNYKKLVRIFKNIRKTILLNKWARNSELNKYFIELILYNVPDSLMKDKDITKCFYKTINFLFNCDYTTFLSFDGKDISTFSLAKTNYSNIAHFLNLLNKFL